MDDHTFKNWEKVRVALEEAGKTDCMFYKRSVAILKGQKDPLESWSKPGSQQ